MISFRFFKLLFIFLAFILIKQNVVAQRNDNNFIVGISEGLLLFYGDVKVNDFTPVLTDKNEFRLGTSLSASKKFNPILEML